MSDGGTKHDQGKLPWHLLPFDAIEQVVRVLDFGAKKYAERNWEKGIAYSRVFAAAQRHLAAWWQGEDKDPETGLSHMAHASCCALFLLAFVARKRSDLDDRPVLKPATWNGIEFPVSRDTSPKRGPESSPPGYLGRVEPSPLGPVEAPPRADTVSSTTCLHNYLLIRTDGNYCAYCGVKVPGNPISIGGVLPPGKHDVHFG